MKKELRQYRVQPPKGFELDSDEVQSDIKLPSGFTMDEQPSKKKVGSQNLPNLSGTSTTTSSSLGGKENQKVSAGVSGGVQIGIGDDPIKHILNPLRQDYKIAQDQFASLRNRATSDQTKIANIPVGVKNQMFDESDFNKKQEGEKIANKRLFQTEEVIKRQVGNVKVARELLDNVRKNNDGKVPANNETAKIATQSINDYNSLSSGIVKNKSILGAAIEEERKDNPVFANHYKTLGGKIPKSYEGKLLYGYLQRHGENLQNFIEEHPEYKNQFDDITKNFAEKYPETTAAQIGNEVSQAYEKQSHAAADFNTEGFNNKVDEIAANLYKDNPEKLELYNKLVKDNKKKYFKSAAALNSFGGEILTGLNSSMNTLRTLVGNRDAKERAFDELDKEAQFINPNAKGIREWVSTGSGFLGLITQVASGGSVLKGLGATEIGANAVPNIVRFHDDELKKAEGRFGDSWKSKLSADVTTALFAYGLPANKLRGAIDNALKDVGEKASVSSVRARITSALKESGKQYLKGTADMTAITGIGQVVDAALGKPHENAEDELFETAKSMAMGNIAPALIHGAGRYFGAKVEKPIEETKSEYTPQEESAINALIEKDPQQLSLKPSVDVLKDANSTPEQKKQALKEIYDQLTHPENEAQVGQYLGKAADAVYDLPYQNETKNARVTNTTTPATNEAGAEVRDTENEQARVGELDNGLQDGVSSGGGGAKYESKFPKPIKPLEELTSEELYDYAKTVKAYNKNIEKEFFGEDGARKYKEAQSISNNHWNHTKEEIDAANKTIRDMEESLSPEQQNEFFGINFDGNGLYDHQEIAQVASKVSLIEQAENVNDIARSLKLPLLSFSKNKNNTEAKILFNAAIKKSNELGVSPEQLIRESIENIAKDIPDQNDRAFLAKSVLDSIVRGSQTQTENAQKQLGNSGSGKDVGGEKVGDNGDFGYHGGSLKEKSDYLEAGYRGDMPFTGHYFFSDRKRAEDRGNRSNGNDEVSVVDFSKYNLLKPTTNEYWSIKSGLKRFEDRFLRSDIDAAFKSLDDYGGLKDSAPKLYDEILANKDKIKKAAEDWRSNELGNIYDKKRIDRLETVILKTLGYEGVDVRGLKESNGEASPDSSTEGSVIFDLKPESIKQKPTNEIPISTESQSNTIKEANTVEQSTSEGEKTSQPTEPIIPTNEGQPPSKEPPVESGEGGKPPKGNKALATRLVEASNVSEEAKSGIVEKGLKYEPKSQKEAEQVAKSVIDEIGIDDAVEKARAQTFGGDVNTLIQTEALNRLKELEDAAKTPEEKRAYAEKFAEVSIALDEWARDKAGRGISALNYFYKKSPLGIQIAENVKRGEAFKEWSKNKEQSWKEFFEELRKEPDFEKEVQEVVGKEVKAERAKERAERKEKVHKAIDDTMAKWAKKLKAKGTDDAQKQGIGVDEVFKAAAATMKKAYDAGEAVVKIVNDAIEYISKQLGRDDWGKEEFKKEWEQRLADKKAKKKLTDEELKARVIDKFRKKLKGLSDKQKEEVVRRAFKELVENGALEYDDFKKIISDVTGRGEMTPDEAKRLRELVEQTNNVEKAAKELQEKRTDEAFIKYRTAMLETAKATKELNEMLWNKPNIMRRLTSIMQLNTLGIPSLINNPIYNMWNQAFLRFPVGIVNDAIDRAISVIAKVGGKEYQREYNTWETQIDFFKGLGLGSKESFEQLFTGLNRQDYIQKELYGQQLRPARAFRDLTAWAQGKKRLSKQQVMDKALQSTVGVPAEVVARMLNIGDKPQRFGAERAQGAAFAKSLGLKEVDYKLFLEFPREESYRYYKQKGLSDAEAGQKADYIKESIIKEGQRSTFQQDNYLNDMINRVFGGEKSGIGSFAKSLTISPFIKIPSNAFWSFYNLVNPEIAILQSMIHGGRAASLRSKDPVKAKLQLREARYWFAHAIVGMGMRAVVMSMVNAGIFIPANTDDDTKKEREGESFFEPQGTVNVTKLRVWLQRGDPSKVKGGLTVQNRWFAQFGTMGNLIARKDAELTPEQRKKQVEFWDIVFGGMEIEGLKEAQNGLFANTSNLLSIINSNPSYGIRQYGWNVFNMLGNTVHPASFAQMSRAQLPTQTTTKADTFMGELKNQILTRSSLVRKLSDQYPPSKISIWGEPMTKPDNTMMRLFGIHKDNPDAFARPIYEDYKKTADVGFFPPAIKPQVNGQKLTVEQSRLLETYVGQARKNYIAPYVNDEAYIPGFEMKYSEIKDPAIKKKVLGYLYELGYRDGQQKFIQDNPKFEKQEKTDDQEELDEIYRDFMEAVKEE